MTITVEEIRRKYPNPVRGMSDGSVQPPKSYCIGGAFMRELGFWAYTTSGPSIECGIFPAPRHLADVLRSQNPSLPVDASLAYAKAIIRKNDTGNFETAWGLLGDALTWNPIEEWTEADTAAMREFAGLNA